MAGIGADIRALRKARGITIQALSAAVGRSVGWLSQVERGIAEPSVRDLGLVADRLGVSISLFFRAAAARPEEQGRVVRSADRIPIGSRAGGLTEELLSPTLGGAFEMIGENEKTALLQVAKDYYYPLMKEGVDIENVDPELWDSIRMSLNYEDVENRVYRLAPVPAAECAKFRKKFKAVPEMGCR